MFCRVSFALIALLISSCASAASPTITPITPTATTSVSPKISIPAGPTDAGVLEQAAQNLPPSPEQVFALGAGQTRVAETSEYSQWGDVGTDITSQTARVTSIAGAGTSTNVVVSGGQWAVVASGDGMCKVPADSAGSVVAVPYFRPDWATSDVTRFIPVDMVPEGGYCTAVQINSHWRMVGVKDGVIYSMLDVRPDGTYEVVRNPLVESPEQKATRELTEAVASGLRINNPDTWTGQYAQYAEWYRNASHPELVSDAQLSELNTFMQNGRKADQLRYFAQNPENAKIILTDFLVQFVPGSITREAAAGMTVEDLETIAYSQNEYLRQFLELRYHALTGEETLLSPSEITFGETDPNGNIIFHGTWENGEPSSDGFYGKWVNQADKFRTRPGTHPMDLTYSIPMFGRDVVRTGPVFSSPIIVDLAGYGKAREGAYYIYCIMKDLSGKSYIHTYMVATDVNNPVVIPEGSAVVGAFGTNEDHWNIVGRSRELRLTTLIAVDNNSFGEYRKQLTLDVLKSWLRWPPAPVTIYTGGIFLPTGTAEEFFDPVTGVEIIGSEAGGHKLGYLLFTTNLQNPYP